MRRRKTVYTAWWINHVGVAGACTSAVILEIHLPN